MTVSFFDYVSSQLSKVNIIIEFYKRNYEKEYNNYHSSDKAKKQRARNNAANRLAGTYGNNDGVDIAHLDNDTNNNDKKNLSKQHPSKNRSFERTKKAKRKKKKEDSKK